MLQSPWIAIDQKGLYKGVGAGINVIPSNDYNHNYANFMIVVNYCYDHMQQALSAMDCIHQTTPKHDTFGKNLITYEVTSYI